jgi:hypothetical protein
MRIQAELGVTRLFEGVRVVTRWLVGNYHPPHTGLAKERSRRRSHSESKADAKTSPEEVKQWCCFSRWLRSRWSL